MSPHYRPTHPVFHTTPPQNLGAARRQAASPGPYPPLTPEQEARSVAVRGSRREEERQRQRTYRAQQAKGLPLRYPLPPSEAAALFDEGGDL